MTKETAMIEDTKNKDGDIKNDEDEHDRQWRQRWTLWRRQNWTPNEDNQDDDDEHKDDKEDSG
jgi:hypothetical protein